MSKGSLPLTDPTMFPKSYFKPAIKARTLNVRFINSSPRIHLAMKYIFIFIFIIMYTKSYYVHSKIIRVDHHYFAPFTLIDSNKRLVWNDTYCVQNFTDKATVYECVRACVLNKNCTTFNYHKKKKICELLNKSKFDALGILQYQPGWLHYETDDDVRLMGPACHQLKPCKLHEVCEDTFTSELYICKCQDGFNGTKCENYTGPGSNQNAPAPACSLLMKRYKNIPDGEYWIERRNGIVFRRNCSRRNKNEKGKHNHSTIFKGPNVTTNATRPPCIVLKYFEKEEIIERGRLVKTIPRLCKYYRVSFEVYPTSYQSSYQNKKQYASIIHLSIGNNIGQNGDRIPGIWFQRSNSSAANKLLICSSVHGNTNYCFNSKKEFPVNNWIKIKVEQTNENGNAMYRIYIDDKKVHEKINSKPSDFNNVKVFVGDPWYPSQNGTIRNLIIDNQMTSGSIFKYFVTEEKIVRSRLVTTIPKLSKYYMVSFEVFPTRYQEGWRNILHMSIGKSKARYGDRTPGIWFHPTLNNATMNKLYICSAINGNKDYWYSSTKEFPLNNWIKVKVEQTEENGKATYKIYLGGEKVHEMINKQPSHFDNVKVYVSNPWAPPQAGKIRNLVIDNAIA